MGGGGGGDRSLSRLGIALTIVFVITLLALLAQLFYVLWRRRVFRRQTYIGGAVSSKEFLFFFCMRSNSNSVAVTGERSSNRRLDMEVVDIDLLKLQGMFGPPRFLFTIKEEEREGIESPADKSLHSAEKEAKKSDEVSKIDRVSLEECFKVADAVVDVEIDGGDRNDATPYTTPCASPTFLTPSSSPDEKAFNVPVTEQVGICSDSKTTPQVKSEE